MYVYLTMKAYLIAW